MVGWATPQAWLRVLTGRTVETVRVAPNSVQSLFIIIHGLWQFGAPVLLILRIELARTVFFTRIISRIVRVFTVTTVIVWRSAHDFLLDG